MAQHRSGVSGAIDGVEFGIRLRVRVQPRASRTEIAGPYGDAIKIRVAGPPVDGAANEELVRFLAKRLNVPASAVSIVAGESARSKLVEVVGVDAAAARAALEVSGER